MISYLLYCRDCQQRFTLSSEVPLGRDERACPHCDSRRVRHTLWGIVRNLDVAAHDGEKLKPKKCA